MQLHPQGFQSFETLKKEIKLHLLVIGGLMSQTQSKLLKYGQTNFKIVLLG